MSPLESSEGDEKHDKTDAAIRVTNAILDTIFHERKDILAQILSLRLLEKTYDDIAEELQSVLAEVKARSGHVRRNIVARICTKIIHPDLHEEIKRHTRHAKKMPPMSEKMKKALEKGQNARRLYRSEQIDAALAQYAATMLYTSGPNNGSTNWLRIAEAMKEQHGLDYTSDQWKKRLQHLRQYKKTKEKSS